MIRKFAERYSFLGFAAVGVIGFFVDAAVLLTVKPALGAYLGRVVSFLAAMTTTYALNRHFVFHKDSKNISWLAGWAKFGLANALGGLINYATYAVLVSLLPNTTLWVLVALACGSLAGLISNYFLSSRWVFGKKTGKEESEL